MKPQPQGGLVATSLIPLNVLFQGGVKEAGFAWERHCVLGGCSSLYQFITLYVKASCSGSVISKKMYSRPKLSLYSWSVSPMSSHVLNFPLTRVFITRLKPITAISLKAMSYCSIYFGHLSLGMTSHHIISMQRVGVISEIMLTTSFVLNFNPWFTGCLLPRALNILFPQHLSALEFLSIWNQLDWNSKSSVKECP